MTSPFLKIAWAYSIVNVRFPPKTVAAENDPLRTLELRLNLIAMNVRLVAGALALCASTACLSNKPSTSSTLFHGTRLQTAEVTGVSGSRTIVLEVFGDPKLGAAVQSPCELHAKEDATGKWRLVPFQSDLMDVDAEDIEHTSFTLKWEGPNRFVVDTDFNLCAVGLSFSGRYRAR